MPLKQFVWDTEPSTREGERGFAGTAIDDDGNIVKVFVTQEALLELQRRDQAKKSTN